jgi:hypothetical protein
MGIVTTNVFHPLHRPIEFLPSSTEIHGCLPVLLSVLLSTVIERMQGAGCFREPTNEEERAVTNKDYGSFYFAYNSSLIVGTIAEDDYKDNDGGKME